MIDPFKKLIEENKIYVLNFNVNNKHSLGINKSRISDLYNSNCRFTRKVIKVDIVI
jgi:hypothetical protein